MKKKLLYFKQKLLNLKQIILKLDQKLLYFKQNLLKIILLVVLFLSFFFFEKFWVGLLNTYWVNPIMSKMNNQVYLWIIPYALFLVFYYYYVFVNEKIVNKRRFLSLLALELVFFICYFSGNWDYYRYSNVLVFPLILETIFIIKCYFNRNRGNDASGQLSFELETSVIIGEKSDTLSSSDSYKRTNFIKQVSSLLKNNFHEENCFAIGVTGSWGTGKTSFINSIKHQLKGDKTINIMVFFPWKSNSKDQIITDFFESFTSTISKFAPEIVPFIDDYTMSLLDKCESSFIKTTLLFTKLFRKKLSKKELYDSITKTLQRIKSHTIIIIDDIDRLDPNEVVEVLRLIRNTANFPYVQFLVAYDKDYILNSLVSLKIQNPNEFLEKIFNLELVLPKFEERVICTELNERLNKLLKAYIDVEHYKDKIIDMLFVINNDEDDDKFETNYLVPKILKTQRDVIRFCNSFKILLTVLGDRIKEQEINYSDLFYLELLRYSYFDVYSCLRDRPLHLLGITTNGVYFLSDSNNNNIVINKKMNGPQVIHDYFKERNLYDSQIIYSVLSLLFKGMAMYDSIQTCRSYEKYFAFRNNDLILTQVEMVNLLSEYGTPSFLEEAESLYSKKNPMEFYYQFSYCLSSLLIFQRDYAENNQDETLQFRLDYQVIYNAMTYLIEFANIGLRNEIIKAIIPHIENLVFYSPDQLRMLLNMINIPELGDDNELQTLIKGLFESLLLKPNLNEKINNNNQTEYVRIIKEWLEQSNRKLLFSNNITSLLDSLERDQKDDNTLTLNSNILKEIQIQYFSSIENKCSKEGF